MYHLHKINGINLEHFKDFLKKYVCTLIKDEVDHFEEKFAQILLIFVKKVRSGSGSGSIIPDPSSPTSFWSEPEWIEY